MLVLLLALVFDHLLARLVHVRLVGPGGDVEHGLLQLVAQGEEVASACAQSGAAAGDGAGRAIDEVAHGGGHAERGEGVDVRGRAAETRAVEQVGGLGRSHWSEGKRREHGQKNGFRWIITVQASGSCGKNCVSLREHPCRPEQDWPLLVAEGSSIYGLTGLGQGVVRLWECSFTTPPADHCRADIFMRFTNLTRHTEIGANSYLLELGGRRVVLDCGMHPKLEGDDATPNLRLVPDGELDAILVTHAHLDHIGSLPVLMRRQPRARVFMSAPTAYLGEALLHNSVNVMARPNGRGAPTATATAARRSRRADRRCSPTARPTSTRRSGSRARCGSRGDFDGERLARPARRTRASSSSTPGTSSAARACSSARRANACFTRAT